MNFPNDPSAESLNKACAAVKEAEDADPEAPQASAALQVFPTRYLPADARECVKDFHFKAAEKVKSDSELKESRAETDHFSEWKKTSIILSRDSKVDLQKYF